MNYSELTAAISVFAVAIADCIADTNDLALLATVIGQLSNTLDTLVVQRALLDSLPQDTSITPIDITT